MESLIINASIALISLITIIISLTFMADNCGLSFLEVLLDFLVRIFLYISAILLGCGIPYLLAFIFDLTGRTLLWYSNLWLIFGIYVCPLLFGLGVMMELYFSLTTDNFLLLNHRIRSILHAQCILLIFALITCVVINICSGFLAMIAIFFYPATLGINLVTTFLNKAFLWLIPHLVGQVMPFVYFSFCPLILGLAVMMELSFSLTRDVIVNVILLILYAHCILLKFALITCVVINIGSGFPAMIAIFFYTATLGINLVTTFLNKAFLWLIPRLVGALHINSGTTFHNEAFLCRILHLVAQVMPFVYFSFRPLLFVYGVIMELWEDNDLPLYHRSQLILDAHCIVLIFAPITCVVINICSGFLAMIVIFIYAATFILVTTFHNNDIIFRQAKIIISGILVVAVIFIVTIYTPVGFPYRADSTPQRYVVAHTARSFNDFDASVRQSDSGFTIYTSDHLSPASIKDHVINASLIQNIQTDFPSDLLCGFSTFTNNSTTYWIPAKEPRLLTVPNIRLVSKDTFSNGITRFSLELKGPDSMYIIITPASNEIELVNWSLPVPFVMQQWTAPYLIKFTYGVVDPSPAEIFFDFKIPEDWTDQTFGIGVVGRWKHHSMHYTDKFKEFLESFPDWAYVHSWIGSYDSWVF